MAVQLDFFKSIAYFAGLNEAELELVRKHAFEKSVEKGEIVVYEGELAEALYFVAGGVLKIFKTSAEGKEQILMLVRPGESFNDVPVFEGGQNLASARHVEFRHDPPPAVAIVRSVFVSATWSR